MNPKILNPDKVRENNFVSNPLFEQVIRNLQLGVYIYHFQNVNDSKTSRLIYANETASTITGTANETILGVSIDKIFPVNSDIDILREISRTFETQKKLSFTGIQCALNNKIDDTFDLDIIPMLDNRVCITFKKSAQNVLDTPILASIKKAIDSSSLAIGITTAAGKYYYQNEAFTTMFGYDPEESREMHLSKFYAGQSYVQDIFKTIESGESWAREVEIIKKNGEHDMVFLQTDAIINENNDVIGIIGVHGEITIMKKTESELLTSLKRLELISNSVHDGIIMMDHAGKINFWNYASQQLFGYTKEDVIGRDFHKLFVPQRYHESSAVDLWEPDNTDNTDTAGQPKELMGLTKSGDEIPLKIIVSPVIVDNNWHSLAIIKDITQQIQSREYQSQKIKQYTALINAVPSKMYIKDINLKYVVVNDSFCQSLNLERNQIIGRSVNEIYPEENAHIYNSKDLEVLSSGRGIINREIKTTSIHGDVIWLSITKVPIFNSDGEIYGIVGISQDVTDFHLSREQLLQSEKLAAIGTLAAGVAHEINNPIGYIKSNLNTMGKYLDKINKLLEGARYNDSNSKEYLDEIINDFKSAVTESQEGTQRVAKIVADLKTFSRVDKSEKELADINEGIESTLNIVWNELKYKCKVEKDFGQIPELLCNLNQLNQVFMNIMVNAGHSIDSSDGLIKIKTWADDKAIYASFQDNGCGISDDNLKKIFEPFYTTKEVGKGTGLGLSLAFDIIKKHRGRIEVQSKVGVGTNFKIILPHEGLHEII